MEVVFGEPPGLLPRAPPARYASERRTRSPCPSREFGISQPWSRSICAYLRDQSRPPFKRLIPGREAPQAARCHLGRLRRQRERWPRNVELTRATAREMRTSRTLRGTSALARRHACGHGCRAGRLACRSVRCFCCTPVGSRRHGGCVRPMTAPGARLAGRLRIRRRVPHDPRFVCDPSLVWILARVTIAIGRREPGTLSSGCGRWESRRDRYPLGTTASAG
jgi:hypothetical protein